MLSTSSSRSRAAHLSTAFFENRHLLLLSILIILVAGLSAFVNLPRIEDPRITTRNATIVTALPGASAERVEALVTEKLEDRLREVSEIREIESTSRAGVSVISIELADSVNNTNNDAIFSKVRDKLADAERELPPAATRPEFDDKRGAVAYTLIAAIKWQRDDSVQLGILNRLADELAHRLRNLTGTEIVRIFGEPNEEITVTFDPAELAALGLTVSTASQLVAAADAKTPAGVLRTSEHDVLLEVGGELDSTARVASIPLIENGTGGLVTLGDVAMVTKDWQDPTAEIALADGARALFVAARVERDVQVDRWSAAAREVVGKFAHEVDAGVGVEITFDQSRYTAQRLSSLSSNLLAGAGVVIFVLFLTMGLRAALVVGIALPLSAAAATFGLTFFGEQIHQMSIFGMIIAIGLLIDNAIVMTDEVRAQLRAGKQPQEAVAASVSHLFVPLLASTFTTILGFMPIFLLPGNVGDFVGPIAISVVLALVASFMISMTIIPSLAALLARPGTSSAGARWWHDGLQSQLLTLRYRSGLLLAVRRPLHTILLAATLPLAGFWLATTLGNQFFPPADRDQFEVEIWLPSNASVYRTAETAQAVEAEIRSHEGVLNVAWLVGGSTPSVYYNRIMDEDSNPSYAQGVVLTESVHRANVLIPLLQAKLSMRYPEAQIVVSQFGQGPPISAPVALRVYGPDLGQLKEYGEEIRRVMHLVPEITYSRASVRGGEPKLWLEAYEQIARLAGLTLKDVAEQLQGNLEGQLGGTVLEDLEELSVRIRYSNAERGSLHEIASLNLVSGQVAASHSWVPVEAIGRLTIRPEMSSITRYNGERVNNVEAYVAMGALPIGVTRAVLNRLNEENFALAPGYRLELAGDSEEQQQAVGQLLTYLPVLLIVMIATLVLSFRSFTLAAVIGAVAVMSVGLGMLSLWFSGFPLGFNPIIGSAGLVGVAINGSIVVLAAIRANPKARAGDQKAVVAETVGATRHIVSTTITTMAGFVPLLLFTGGVFWPPLAVVIAGGVSFAIILSLLFTPATYVLIYGRRSETMPMQLLLPARGEQARA